VLPAVVADFHGIQDGDGVLCFNFRADRVREILGAVIDPAFSGFTRRRTVRAAMAVGMTQYSEQLSAFMPAILLQRRAGSRREVRQQPDQQGGVNPASGGRAA
jgi:bisphosphoglycerate-independent phosphoglycerate mutase (AlkP superfamily)